MITLTYLGHSAFHLDDGSTTLMVDPYLTGNPAATVSADDFSPDAILLTHAHNDHLGDTVGIAKRAKSQVIASFEIAEWISSQGVERVLGGNTGGTVPFKGGTVKFVPAFHTSSYSFDGMRVAIGLPTGLVVRFGGQTLYFAGDTCLFSDMKLIGEEGLDLAVVPIGDYFTMGPQDALRAVTFLSPGVVVPCHYNTFPPIRQDAAAFQAQVESSTTSRCVPLRPGESMNVG